jgi:hypothetical protein
MDAACAKYVECHALANGTPITTALCAQARAQSVAKCEADDASTIGAGSDAEVDQCASEMAAMQCTDICNKIPMDPPTCHQLSPAPNTDMVSCAP